MKIRMLLAASLLALPASLTASGGNASIAIPSQVDSAHTPARGSAERKAILDAMRAHRRRFDAAPVIFVVGRLRVQRGWAWLTVAPQSPDGRSRFEAESALLRRHGERWEVVETMPAFGEREGTALERDCAWFADLRRRVPALPAAILPAEGRRPCPRARSPG